MAAPVLTATALGDLVTTTLRELGRGKITDLSSDLNKFTALPKLMRKNTVDIQSGYGVQWNVKVSQASGSSRNVELGAADNVNIVDTMTTATADWRNTVSSWAMIGQEEAFNREPARIVELIKSRRYDAQVALAELMENNYWGPPVAVDDSLTPWGINTWVVKNATEGFNGGAPSGYTTIGLNPTTYPRWKNWTAQYTNVTKDDLIRKMRKAMNYIVFTPPTNAMASYNTGDNYGLYTNYAVIAALEEALEAQNENLGMDVASMDGKVTFHRTPMEWVPKLDADSTNPVYMLNWGWIKTIILQGWWMKETNIPIYPGQHTIGAYFIDSTYQVVTRNRRCHAVIATGTTYPS